MTPGFVAYPMGEMFGALDRGRRRNSLGVSRCVWKIEERRRVKNCPGLGKFEIPVLVLVPLRQEFEWNDFFGK